VSPGDVLVTTVGPFLRLGEAAVTAAIDGGAVAYIDSTGEPPFVRRVFEEWGPRANAAGVALLTAFGYDYVPGNLAAAMVVSDGMNAGTPPSRVDVGYFIRGQMAMSGGTAASSAGVLTAQQFAFSGARLTTVRGGQRWRSFRVGDRDWDGLSLGGTEHFAIPRLCSTITDVNVYLGWAGARTRTMSRLSGATTVLAKVPGIDKALAAAVAKTAPAPGDGPTPEVREQSRTLAVAEAYDGVGRRIGRAVVDGPSPYDLTADLLTWAAAESMAGRLSGAGALGPADAFVPATPSGDSPEFGTRDHIDALIAGCATLGLIRSE
jgi:short subunit dehydrogenase-like uncharacterized protein